MLILLRLAIVFALLAPAILAGVFKRPVGALVTVAIAAVFAELAARYVLGQRTKGHSTPFSEIVMIIAAIVVGVLGAVQVAGALPG